MSGSPWPEDVRTRAVQLAVSTSLAAAHRETGVPKSTIAGWRDEQNNPRPPPARPAPTAASTAAATEASVATRTAAAAERRRIVDDALDGAVAQLSGLLVASMSIESDLAVVQRAINARLKAGQLPSQADLDRRAGMLGGVDVADWTRMRSAAARDLLAIRKSLAGDDDRATTSGPPVYVFATASIAEVNARPQKVYTLDENNKIIDYNPDEGPP